MQPYIGKVENQIFCTYHTYHELCHLLQNSTLQDHAESRIGSLLMLQ